MAGVLVHAGVSGAGVVAARPRKPIRKTFASLKEARVWRQESQAALRKGTMRAPTPLTIRRKRGSMAKRTLALYLLKPEVGRAEDVEHALERGTERRVPIVRGLRRAYASPPSTRAATPSSRSSTSELRRRRWPGRDCTRALRCRARVRPSTSPSGEAIAPRLRLALDQPDLLDEQASPSLEELIFGWAVGDAGILDAVAKAPESGLRVLRTSYAAFIGN